MEPLRVLLTIQTLARRQGGNLYVRDLALQLLRSGHTPIVYCPQLGEVAEELHQATVPVIADLDALALTPDIIHGNTHLETVTALLRFPGVAAVFTCHGWLYWESMPPKVPGIGRYVAVDETCRDRLVCEEGIAPERVVVRFNPVDLARFPQRSPLPAHPRRALIFSNYANDKTHVRAVRAACAERGLALDLLGEQVSRLAAAPEEVLGGYDLVFAKARCALEALAVGNAVVLCDAQGVGEMVTPDNLERLRSQNFGWRALHRPLEAPVLLGEIARYDPVEAATVTRRVREREGVEAAVASLVALYREVIEARRAEGPPPPDAERGALVRYLHGLAPLAGTIAKGEQEILRLSEALERSAHACQMAPLDEADELMLRLWLEEAPAQGRARARGEDFELQVTLENHSGRILWSRPPNPVHLSYHWIEGESGAASIWDGCRTSLEPPLLPGLSRRYRVACTAPAAPGAYLLRLTLVQEGCRWLDDRPDCVVELPISVA